jgi:4-hydroxy-2-oxoheptanedioate aldolase|tara:strand:+ start:1537 stop:2307 length:771 start_codon:yes stop_codon:yes gene_type:complete
MLNQNFLLDKLRNSEEVCFGSWSIVYNPLLVEIITSTEIDFLIFDSEHGPWNFNQIIESSMICEKNQVSPIMRVPDISRGNISKAFDSGIHGVQVPNIGKKEEAEMVVDFSKFTPVGSRGFSPFTRSSNYSYQFSEALINKANDNTAVIIHIENKEGLDNVDEILDQKHIDIVFLGLFDLSLILNQPGHIDHPDVKEKFTFIAEKVISSGKILGSIVTNKDQIEFLTENKVRYLTYSADCQIISDEYNKIFNNLKG